MRNSILGGMLGVILGAAVLAACGGGGSSAVNANATVDELEARIVVLESNITTLTNAANSHAADKNAHMPARGKLVVNYCIAVAGTFPSQNKPGSDPSTASTQDNPHLGAIGLFAGTFAPRGWLFCDGQQLLISQNQSLYSILGTTYGGDGRTTFNLPDLRGRAPIHVGPSDTLGSAAD